MDGTGDQFLARSGFAQNQHGRTRGGHRFGLKKHIFQFGTVPDNLLKMQFGADFIFKIKLLFRQSILERTNFAVGSRVVERDG